MNATQEERRQDLEGPGGSGTERESQGQEAEKPAAAGSSFSPEILNMWCLDQQLSVTWNSSEVQAVNLKPKSSRCF